MRDRQLPRVLGDQAGLLLGVRGELGESGVALLRLLLGGLLELLVGGVGERGSLAVAADRLVATVEGLAVRDTAGAGERRCLHDAAGEVAAGEVVAAMRRASAEGTRRSEHESRGTHQRGCGEVARDGASPARVGTTDVSSVRAVVAVRPASWGRRAGCVGTAAPGHGSPVG